MHGQQNASKPTGSVSGGVQLTEGGAYRSRSHHSRRGRGSTLSRRRRVAGSLRFGSRHHRSSSLALLVAAGKTTVGGYKVVDEYTAAPEHIVASRTWLE